MKNDLDKDDMRKTSGIDWRYWFWNHYYISSQWVLFVNRMKKDCKFLDTIGEKSRE